MSVAQQIASNADYHRTLLQRIGALESAPTSLAGQIAYLSQLKTQLAETEKKVKALEKKTNKERKEHESIQKSVGRRWTAKLTGRSEKFDERKEKEEREFVEAYEEEMRTKEAASALMAMIIEGERIHQDLEQKAAEHARLCSELQSLYKRIFDGPTPEFPQDDNLEYRVTEAQKVFDTVQIGVNAETHACQILNGAERTMRQCLQQIGSAHDASTWDMFGGGALADSMERSALGEAQRFASQTQVMLMQAKMQSPMVNEHILDGLTIAQGNIISDVLFDNVFTDYAFHEKIKQSQADAQTALQLVAAQKQAAEQRLRGLEVTRDRAQGDLARARQELDDFRRSVFEGRQLV